ncbi:quinoprotein dehydrogenase-associated probable ABC transporter substrate-binding protein [Paucibacter oligotrophus]|uniref:Quinoprotein dehydrogenase-associated probable ABC transporter substrate-binding protein n=1 Tax=Roseateles oligotrophus TaxID=1769250 RepID=A0A840LIG0_9BURK|nr:quinoprotein dehydrogenase-associated putative ABC transporter substrate-binding protein [Roseateles oligotrophus]MBB4845769.1 quinoprotein dehydrogenase-associated probable ABC transporter substrate-binding protein [Roseateles oligotrophus]
MKTWLGCMLALSLASAGQAQQPPARTALRVCQDPNNMPFSNQAAEGIENRIAQLFGKALGLPVSYYSFPQRMGFVRNTLRYKLPDQDYPCDIIMGVPVGFDQVAQTRPYYRSTYTLVLARRKGLEDVQSSADFLALPAARREALRIGVYDRSPGSEWLLAHGLLAQGVPYNMLSPNPEQYPGEIIEKDLVQGKLDAAIVWGPIGGYFSKRAGEGQLRSIALPSEPGVRFDYAMAMGVRYGEREWKAQIDQLIVAKQDEIRRILQEFNVPLLDEAGTKAAER